MSVARTSRDLTAILAEARARRDRLIEDHVPMARRISSRMVRGGGPRVDRDDAVAAAMLGLTEAADRFDPTRGEPFVAFAEKRIRGAVLDELRRADFLPRRVRRMARRAAEVCAALDAAGVPATDEAIAAALGVTADEYRDDIAPLAGVGLTSLDAHAEPPTATPSPADEAELREVCAKAAAVVDAMSPREAHIMALHYGGDQPYRAIAQALGLTASRVCQLHTRALDRIRAVM